MSGWGIGLGSFVNGMQSGYGIGQRMRSDRMTNEMNQIKLQDMQRTQQQKQQMDALGKQGNAGFEAAVANGQADPSHPDEWFSQNYAPKMESFFLSNGDVESAAKWNKWSNDTTTKKQIKSMGQVLGRLYDGHNTGDYSGLGTELGNFYKTLPDDMRKKIGSFDGLRAETDEQGKFVATASFTDDKGKEHIYSWDSPDALRQSIEGWANPAAIYSETMKSEASAKKYKADLGEYAAKKGIDLRAAQAERAQGLKGKTPEERYAGAQKTLTESSIDGKPPNDQQVRDFLKQQDDYAASVSPGIGTPPAASGSSAPEPGRLIIDKKAVKAMPSAPAAGAPAAGAAGTGKPLPMPSPESVTAPLPSSAPQQSSAAPQQSAGPTPDSQVPARIAPGISALGAARDRAVARDVPPQSMISYEPSAPAGSGGGVFPGGAQRSPGIGVATDQAMVKNPDGSLTVVLADGRKMLVPAGMAGR